MTNAAMLHNKPYLRESIQAKPLFFKAIVAEIDRVREEHFVIRTLSLLFGFLLYIAPREREREKR